MQIYGILLNIENQLIRRSEHLLKVERVELYTSFTIEL